MTLNARQGPDEHRQFLVIVRAGSRSLHSQWIAGKTPRGFDLLISAYDPSVEDPGIENVFWEFRPGRKVAGYAELLKDRWNFIQEYQFIALFDDDLSMSGDDIDRCFSYSRRYNLKISQPSLTHDSYFTYAGLLQDKSFSLRFINYIEMMCPIFRRDTLKGILPLFSMGYESGIDLVWCNVGDPLPRDFAVIDAVAIKHTRPVGTLKSANGFTGERRYEDDIYAILKRYSLPWLSCVPFGGIRRDGSLVRKRIYFIFSSIKLAGSIFRKPDWANRGRHVLVHWKHLLQRRARNIPVDLDEASGLV